MHNFNVGDLATGLGHTGLLRVTKSTHKRVEVEILNPQVMNVICADSCLKTSIQPATAAEVEAGVSLHHQSTKGTSQQG